MDNQNLHHFCLPKDKVYLAEVSSSSQFSDKEIIKKADFDSLINALKYRYTLNYLGKSYENITVPCIPAREYSINQSKQQKSPERKIPYLIKVPYQTSLQGFASGKRSAIILKDGKLLRFKGCGNLNQGFTVEKNQPRGSHYCHTAKRQIYMTTQISNRLFKKLGIYSANKPVCAFQFDENIVDLKISNELPLLRKYCCVFQTVGDRRAGTHLISPLQIMFLNLCQIQAIDWKSIFVNKKRHNEDDGLIESMVDYQLEVLKGQHFIDKYDKRPDISQRHVDLVQQKDINVKNLQNFKQILETIAAKFLKSQADRQRFLNNLSNINNFATIISVICAKIGYQMGRIKRVFCEQGINWGFFNDHGSWHCNAHLNNLIVCQPSKNGPLMLPLDFDLAFFKDEFINIDLKSQNYGKPDEDLFEELLLGQYNSMEYSLSGFEIMENFSYEIIKKSSSDGKAETEQKQKARMARTAFRDTLINCFRAGMRNKQQVSALIQQKWQQNIEAIKSIVDSCLLISAEFQT